jgi:hypothetical protein
MYRQKRARMPRPRGWSSWDGGTAAEDDRADALRSLTDRLSMVGQDDEERPSS